MGLPFETTRVQTHYPQKQFPCKLILRKLEQGHARGMSGLKLREVKLWQADLASETRADGTILVWQTGQLPDGPVRLSDRIRQYAAATPDVTWMAERGPDGAWIRVTYAQLLERIRRIGQALLDHGLSVDRPLLILSGNSLAHALMALGAQYAGIPSAAVAPAYALASKDHGKLRAIGEQITPGAVFADDLTGFLPAIEACFAGLPRFDSDLPMADPRTVDAANAATGPDTVAKFMFTSGTTGTPKAVIQTQRMLCANMAQITDCYAWLAEEPPVFVDWAPWNHVASGNKVFNMTFWNGGTYYIDGGKPTPQLFEATLKNLKEISPTWYFNVPAGFEMLVEAMKSDPGLAKSFFKQLKMLMYAGAALAAHTWRDLERLAVEATGEYVLLTTGLGATETAPFALFSTQAQASPGNVGIPAKGIVLKLVPFEDRYEARLKGPNVTPGYWRNSEMTAQAFDEEGFYRLGDALRFADPADAGKGFFFAGRTAENFKMATATWVAVGPLRAALIDALGGLARDVVITGEGRDALGALLVPFRPALEKIAGVLPDRELFADVRVRDEISARLSAYNKRVSGASLKVPLALVLEAPLDLDKGEVTDKGSVNQRAVLRHRADLVDVLYGDDPRVIRG
jgi:feruloyl-CoA synthase